MTKTTAASAALAALLSASVSAESNFGQMYWKSVTCGPVKANLMVNHRTVAQPTLFMNSTPIRLEDGPNYSGPICVTFRGEKKVGYTATVGNAYEGYFIVDLDTFRVSEITRQQAVKIGF